MRQLFIEPLDVWLFRDGRPFAAGSDHRAESLFPPFPTTTLGAIRRQELSRQNIPLWDADKIKAAVGEPFAPNADLKGLKLHGPFVALREQTSGKVIRVYPQPADADIEKIGAQYFISPFGKPAELPDGVCSSLPQQKLSLGFEKDYEKQDVSLWVTEENLRGYLKGDKVPALRASDLFVREERVSIGMDNGKNTTLSGALYEVQFIRPLQRVILPEETEQNNRYDVGLLVEMSANAERYDWSKIAKGIFQLGGESRAAMYETVQSDPFSNHKEQTWTGQFKVYFATPAYFSGGWEPKGSQWTELFDGITELRAAAIGRYVTVGGFDLAAVSTSAGAHRASRRFVPAGSVYYFQFTNASLKKSALTELGDEIGLGQIIIEEW